MIRRGPEPPRALIAIVVLALAIPLGAVAQDAGDVRILDRAASGTDASTSAEGSDSSTPAGRLSPPALARPERPGLPAAPVSFTLGLNYPWYTDAGVPYYGNIFGDFTPARRALAERNLREMAACGIHALRFWVYAAGGKYPERDGAGFKRIPQAVVDDLAWFVHTAASYGIYSIPVIWDFLLNRDHPEYIADASLYPKLIDAAVTPLVRGLANEPGVLVWDVVNEPEWMLVETNWRADNTSRIPFAAHLPGAPAAGKGHSEDTVEAWIKAHVDAIHAAGGRATVGAASFISVRLWKGLGLDLYQIHYYPIVASNWLGDSLYRILPSPKHLGLDRPCVLGEFCANAKGTSIPGVVKIIRDKGYAGAWAWCYYGVGNPEDLANRFSFHARMAEFTTAGAGP